MTSGWSPFDAVLAFSLVAVGLRVLLARDLFQAAVLFIAFGLLMAMAWCRLQAVDVALAEAAIGAGLTGSLFLNALAATREQQDPGSEGRASRGARGKLARAAGSVLLLALAFLAMLAAAVALDAVPLAETTRAVPVAPGAVAHLSGVPNPVTAVLLNFRAYDTLLESTVLFLAVLAVLPASTEGAAAKQRGPTEPTLAAFVRLVVPAVVLVATYLLWNGTKGPGGAFQAAAVLAAGGVLLLVTGVRPPTFARIRWRIVAALGLALFCLVGAIGMPQGRHALEYPSKSATPWILLVETALTVSIALILIMLFSGVSARDAERESGS